jgi:hypothetical protein
MTETKSELGFTFCGLWRGFGLGPGDLAGLRSSRRDCAPEGQGFVIMLLVKS